MKEVKESLIKRARGSRAQADVGVRLAEDKREEAQKILAEAIELEEEAVQMRAEADELDRIRVLAYGSDE